jgi:hypothetical protein
MQHRLDPADDPLVEFRKAIRRELVLGDAAGGVHPDFFDRNRVADDLGKRGHALALGRGLAEEHVHGHTPLLVPVPENRVGDGAWLRAGADNLTILAQYADIGTDYRPLSVGALIGPESVLESLRINLVFLLGLAAHPASPASAFRKQILVQARMLA